MALPLRAEPVVTIRETVDGVGPLWLVTVEKRHMLLSRTARSAERAQEVADNLVACLEWYLQEDGPKA